MHILRIVADIFRWPTMPGSELVAGPVYVSRLFFVVIWGLFAVALMHEVSYLRIVSRRMRRLLSGIRAVTADQISTREECNRLEKAFADAGAVAKHAWHEFRETLVEYDGTVFNTVDARQFLDAERLRGHRIPPRLIREVPAALTALGILGTFLGLILGLRGLNIQIGTDEYIQSVDRLIQGIDTAYYTSIWGITASLLFMGSERYLSGRAGLTVRRVTDHLDSIFQRKTEEEILLGVLRCEEDLAGVMKSFSTDLSDTLRRSLEESVERHLRPPIDQIAKLVTDVANYASANQAEGVQAIVDSALAKIQNAVTDRVEELAAAIGDTVEQNRAFCETLRETSGKLDESTLLQMEAVEKYVDATGRLGAVAELMEQAEEAMSNRSKALGLIVGRLSEVGHELATVCEQLSVLRGAFESCNTRAAESISQLSRIWDSHATAMRELNNELTRGMASYSQQVSGNLRDSLGEFDEHLGSATRTLGVAVKDLQDTLDDLGDQLQRLRAGGES